MNELKKIIIDTDIGDDADDALAIALAVRSGVFDILGITTVFRNTYARAKIASSLLSILDVHDVPVVPGVGHPIINEANTITPPTQYFPEMENAPILENVSAIEFLYEQIKKYPGEVTLVPIGPLTNIAMLIRIHPDVIPMVKEIVMMGGAFYFHYDEWNMVCDPEASAIVFGSGIPIKAVGLDVTLKCPVTDELQNEINSFGTPLTDLLGKLLLHYRAKRGRNTYLHDPLALMALTCPDLFEFKKESINVELKGEHTRGMTFRKTKLGKSVVDEKSIEAAATVKEAEAVEYFRHIILR